MDRIKVEDVILIHKIFEDEHACDSGIRDINIIDSAISSAYQSAFGEDIFKEDIDKISRIGLGIASNHGFVDGNKRTGLATIVALCKVNNIKLPNENDLYNIIMEASEDHESSWSEKYERFNLKLKIACEITTLEDEIYKEK